MPQMLMKFVLFQHYEIKLQPPCALLCSLCISMPRWVEEERPDNEESTDESEFDDEDIVEDEEPAPQRQLDDIVKDKEPQRQRIKVALNKATGDLSCHVCGQRGHQAGFVGSVYLDCINKPCYLCKQPGHTTATCPHRTAPETGCTSAANSKADALLPSILNRCCTPCSTINTAVSVPEYAVDAAILKLLSRRCTCLEFHPNRDNLVLCGDKKGHVAVRFSSCAFASFVWLVFLLSFCWCLAVV